MSRNILSQKCIDQYRKGAVTVNADQCTNPGMNVRTANRFSSYKKLILRLFVQVRIA
jgi:hypothetical protein